MSFNGASIISMQDPSYCIILKPLPPGWIQEETKNSGKKVLKKKEAFSGPAVWHMCRIVHHQVWAAGPSSGRWFSKPAGKASRQELPACTLPLNNTWTGLCTYLINGSTTCFSPKLAGALLNVFLDSLPKMQLAASSPKTMQYDLFIQRTLN